MPESKNKKIIIGLGNPGVKYQNTRHNVGFLVIDRLLKDADSDCNAFSFHKKFNAKIADFALLAVRCLLIKPQIFMNNSGQSVSKIAHYYKVDPVNIIVIHDDIDLPLGSLRIKLGGSSAGHNGVQSIINHLGSPDFIRFRIGVGPVPARHDPADFVLSPVLKKERSILNSLVKLTAEAVRFALKHSLQEVSSKFN